MASSGNNAQSVLSLSSDDPMGSSSKQVAIRPHYSNMLLKDYLIRDDLSSCSSNGFKSLPRRQCCTTVRFDLLQDKRNRLLLRPCSLKAKAASSTLSALQKAKQAVINAVKSLPFPSPNKSKSKRRLLSKSLSRGSFWRKSVKLEVEEDGIIPRWKSFRDFLEEDKPSDQNAHSSTEFSWDMLNSTQNDVVSSKDDNALLHNKTTANPHHSSILHKPMDWGSEEKEQFSPVSVLDCPFGDDEDINSPLDSTSSRRQGSKHKDIHKHKSRKHFDGGVASLLQPVELEKRMALLSQEEEEEEEAYKRKAIIISVENEKMNKKEEELKRWRLVEEVESSMASKCLIIMSNAEKLLLLDLLSEECKCNENAEKDLEVLKVAEEWINGNINNQEANLGWEMCVKDMDKCGRWTNISEEEKGQVGTQLEFEVFTSLINDIMLELIS